MPGASVNEHVNEPVDRPSRFVLAGQLRQAIGRGANAKVIAAYREQLRTERAERALRRILDEAPPLGAEQVAYLRSVLAEYGEVES